LLERVVELGMSRIDCPDNRRIVTKWSTISVERKSPSTLFPRPSTATVCSRIWQGINNSGRIVLSIVVAGPTGWDALAGASESLNKRGRAKGFFLFSGVQKTSDRAAPLTHPMDAPAVCAGVGFPLPLKNRRRSQPAAPAKCVHHRSDHGAIRTLK